jgi:hypothetical protein
MIDYELLRSRLKLRHLAGHHSLVKKHPHIGKFLMSGLLTGSILTGSGVMPAHANSPRVISDTAFVSKVDLAHLVAAKFREFLPEQVGPIDEQTEDKVTQVLQESFGIKAVAKLDGNKLNQSYGLIGAEQHLPRYPGDTIENHDEFQKAGITPGLGAWRYFANNKAELTPDLIQKEKYYVAVQTLYLPDWSARLAYLRDWYRYRKVVVVNPVNGKADVAVVADAGPAQWTGKHFGGSPEIMAHLGLNVGMQKGAVILFFVDDPQDKIPLGPL